MEILDENISFADFLVLFDGEFVEWVDGIVYKMPSVTPRHQKLEKFLINLLDTYLFFTGGGITLRAPFIMHPTPNIGRSPDIQVLLSHNLHRVREHETYGAADLVVEVVSEESYELDWTTKLKEYEFGRIGEYWIIDPVNEMARFCVLKRQECYVWMGIVNGIYRSTVLPGLKFPYDMLWQEDLPTSVEITDMVKTMLQENE